MYGIYEFLIEINESNSTNHKLQILNKHKNDETIQLILKMTYDKVRYTYGIKKVPEFQKFMTTSATLDMALNFLLIELSTRVLTGHTALNELTDILQRLSTTDANIILKILDRDLKIGIGKTQINKTWKDLVVDPPYMRCGIYSEKTSSKIKFPAIVQLKADGMYQSVTVFDGSVTFESRSGEERQFPTLQEQFSKLSDGVYIGELLIPGTLSRSEANGLLNSDNPPHEKIIMQLWDCVTIEEYQDAKHTKKEIERLTYSQRFEKLIKHLQINQSENIKVIDYLNVETIQEALTQTSKWMTEGFEGSILKDNCNIFKDHTSPTQLKLKVEIELDVRVTGFTNGTKGTRREQTFGAITYTNDEGTIKGQCSGFTDKQLEEFNSKREELIGKVITVQCNDLTKGRNNEYYALSHPRFKEVRTDKNLTDTLKRALEVRDSAMFLSSF